MKSSNNAETPRRSTGLAGGGEYLPNGKPNLMPAAGYENVEPVQYSDETDAQFADRHLDWETRYQHALDIQNGGASFESSKKALDSRYDADLASLEAQHKDDGKKKKA